MLKGNILLLFYLQKLANKTQIGEYFRFKLKNRYNQIYNQILPGRPTHKK